MGEAGGLADRLQGLPISPPGVHAAVLRGVAHPSEELAAGTARFDKDPRCTLLGKDATDLEADLEERAGAPPVEGLLATA